MTLGWGTYPATISRVGDVLFSPIVFAILVFIGFAILGYIVGRINVRLLTSLGVADIVEGTTFERSARGLGSSTVSVMARLSSWFIYGVGALVALHIMGLLDANLFWQQVTIFVPRLFVAILVIIIGIVVGEKAALVLSERLRSVKLPEISIISALAKYSIIFLAILIALGQVGVVTTALIVVLAAYAFGIVFLVGIACKDLLASGAAGIYLLLHQPYVIGDRITVSEQSGIVQEIDLFVTHIENDGTEFVIPNRHILSTGVARKSS